ncbi:MAG: 4-(cytidine 5'-diphospho)-2-C-methyl-D-erythritol kinase [Burkholderiaceae bacterium]|nr:4-(cytidine 5'-diphospho)-2-C-methyl-D-erythritol kinase [Burkholderiaceae bacterium]MCD8517341.1 4-(cytidine 5'-diphospho)-2-C-methyl-D-erythritol kinase [Burkholderiaceae bacterium]MCD8537642.1 4-(cytidine 5'-diphospho)-2-C-methyl-D-erythritol kinase [Burkholderiaceae bacterium]
MTVYDLPAPAKLNLFLHVVGQRADGYHLLESLFRLISLADSISIDLRLDGQISRESNLGVEVNPDDDLVVRAARLLQQRTGVLHGAHLHVTKRIPVGGGLGGGSSDAATVLIGLNRLWRTGLNRQELAMLGLSLGADVPFFVFGQTAFVQGVGEKLESFLAPDSSYLIFRPPVSVPTAAIFKADDLTRNSDRVKISDFSGVGSFVNVASGQYGFGRNDLEPVAKRLFPIVSDAMTWVSQQGYAVRLSGSGSCFFAEFNDPVQAELARGSLTGKMEKVDNGEVAVIKEVFACDGLPEHPLRHWLTD